MPGTAPTGFQTPKTDWTAANAPVAVDLNRIEGNAQATELGERTVDQAQTPTSSTGTLRALLDWIVNRIKAIVGSTNWYDAPATTLAAAKTHADSTAAGVHGSTTAATANRLAHRDANADLTVRRLISGLATGTSPLSVTSQTVNTNFNADMLDGLHSASFASILSGGAKIQSGSIQVNYSDATVTFSTAYSSAPKVVATNGTDDSYYVSVYSVTATGFHIHLSISNTESHPVHWIAIGA